MRKLLHPVEIHRGNKISASGIRCAAYVAAKLAVTGLTANTDSMYANSGIRDNGIAPSDVMTNIQQSMTCVSELDTGRQGTRLATMPRASQPKEIVQLAFFLASGDLRFIVGQVIAAYTE